MAWAYLLIASMFEIAFAVGMKYSEGFTRLMPSVLTFVTGAASLVILSQSLKNLPVGTAYSVWTGIGAVGTTVVGIFLFDEPRDVPRILCILLIAAGIIGLKLTSVAK